MPSEFYHHASLTLFGIAVHLTSNSHQALVAARACFSSNKVTPLEHGEQSFVYVVLRANAVNDCHAPHVDRVDAHSMSLRFGTTIVTADPARRHGACAFPSGAEAGEAFAEAINTVVLFLVAHAGRTPVHASAFMRRDMAVVLAGRSGAGKSTLALAALKAGFPILSEDTIFVQTGPQFRLWSRTRAIHVLPGSDASEGRMRFRSGRWKQAHPVTQPAEYACKSILCVLEKGPHVALKPMAPDEAVEALTQNPEPGYEFYGHRTADAVRAIARLGAYRLTLSASPQDAIALVCDAVPARP